MKTKILNIFLERGQKNKKQIAYNGGDWRGKSRLQLPVQCYNAHSAFILSNCVLAAVFFSLIFSTLENKCKISLK